MDKDKSYWILKAILELDNEGKLQPKTRQKIYAYADEWSFHEIIELEDKEDEGEG